MGNWTKIVIYFSIGSTALGHLLLHCCRLTIVHVKQHLCWPPACFAHRGAMFYTLQVMSSLLYCPFNLTSHYNNYSPLYSGSEMPLASLSYWKRGGSSPCKPIKEPSCVTPAPAISPSTQKRATTVLLGDAAAPLTSTRLMTEVTMCPLHPAMRQEFDRYFGFMQYICILIFHSSISIFTGLFPPAPAIRQGDSGISTWLIIFSGF